MDSFVSSVTALPPDGSLPSITCVKTHLATIHTAGNKRACMHMCVSIILCCLEIFSDPARMVWDPA